MERNGDLISRQAAMDEFPDVNLPWDTLDGYVAPHHVRKILGQLPPVKPYPRWTPCKARMPEEGSWAIWCSNKGAIQVARWKIDAMDHFYPDQGFFELEDAVAWMPLPEPYMGGEQE